MSVPNGDASSGTAGGSASQSAEVHSSLSESIRGMAISETHGGGRGGRSFGLGHLPASPIRGSMGSDAILSTTPDWNAPHRSLVGSYGVRMPGVSLPHSYVSTGESSMAGASTSDIGPIQMNTVNMLLGGILTDEESSRRKAVQELYDLVILHFSPLCDLPNLLQTLPTISLGARSPHRLHPLGDVDSDSCSDDYDPDARLVHSSADEGNGSPHRRSRARRRPPSPESDDEESSTEDVLAGVLALQSLLMLAADAPHPEISEAVENVSSFYNERLLDLRDLEPSELEERYGPERVQLLQLAASRCSTNSKLPSSYVSQAFIPSKSGSRRKVAEVTDHDVTEQDQSAIATELYETFFDFGCVPFHVRLLCMTPTLALYYGHLRRARNFLLRGNSTISVEIRHYIALQAAAHMQCEYLCRHLEREFLLVGGDPSWLEGKPELLPAHLRRLSMVHALLAHRPWMLSSEMVDEAVRSMDGYAVTWSISELIHAMMIMTTFHSLSGLILGCGINSESYFSAWDPSVLTPALSTCRSSSSLLSTSGIVQDDDDLEPCEVSDANKAMLERLQAGSESHSVGNDAAEQESRRKMFVDSAVGPGASSDESENVPKYDFERYLIGYRTWRYKDFDVRSKEYSVLVFSEFNWADHGFQLASRFTHDGAVLMDDLFNFAYGMTDRSFNSQSNVDTKPLRRAMWSYVHRVYGICHDDYDYADVNIFLNKKIKTFIKKVACFPSEISSSDFIDMGLELRPHEKVHLAALASEARKQACLLYGLRSVMAYMDSS